MTEYNSNSVFVLALISLLLLLGLSQPAIALESDRDQPIAIEADGVELNDGSGVSTYTGSVILTQGSIRLSADKVTVTRRRAKSHHLLAEGKPVTFAQDTADRGIMKGHARRAEYDSDSDILYLIGDASFKQGKESFSSDRITYDRAKATVRAGASAKGKQRVKVSIQPESLSGKK